MLSIEEKDVECLNTISGITSLGEPNIKISVYKNRRGKHKGVYIWCKADLGVCRIEPLFVTTWDYKYVEMKGIKIKTTSIWDKK